MSHNKKVWFTCYSTDVITDALELRKRHIISVKALYFGFCAAISKTCDGNFLNEASSKQFLN